MNTKIPIFVYTHIICVDSCDDGDVWPLDEGYTVEANIHNSKTNFVVKHKGNLVGSVTRKEAHQVWM